METICLKCLEKDPKRRYASAEALAEDLERWFRHEPIEARPVHAMGRVWRWFRREPKLAGALLGIFLLLGAIALLSSTLYQWEKRARIAAEQKSAHELKALVDRMEGELSRGAPAIRISADEVAIVTRRVPSIDSTEKRVTLGTVTLKRLPDRIILQLGDLVHCLQTSAWNRAQVELLFDLRLYRSHGAAAAGLLKGDADLWLVDPAVYVLARQANAQLTPLARQTHGHRPELHGAIVTRTNSGVTNLVDLNGRSFVFGEEDSAIGDHLSKAALVAAGLRRRHLAQTTNLPSSRALTAVRTGVFDAGAVMWSDLERLKQAGGHLRVLQELRCPSPVWVADTRLDTNALAALRDVFLSLADVNILAEVEPELTGFRPARPSDYDALASQIEQAKQFDEP